MPPHRHEETDGRCLSEDDNGKASCCYDPPAEASLPMLEQLERELAEADAQLSAAIGELNDAEEVHRKALINAGDALMVVVAKKARRSAYRAAQCPRCSYVEDDAPGLTHCGLPMRTLTSRETAIVLKGRP